MRLGTTHLILMYEPYRENEPYEQCYDYSKDCMQADWLVKNKQTYVYCS
jgi:hypothetical protein